ncbi:MAG TPA: ABC transporter substrate-binding protein [Mycobacteriales bacterium]|nr:ABC transporter substrate-binding protein [Mycobacteriales bacterium]
MSNPTRRPLLAAALVALTLGAAACSSSSSGGNATVSPAASAGPDSAAVALLPANVKSKGSLTVAADASYAPNEFLASDGTTVQGMDADLAKAIGQELGLTVNVKNATFDAIIPGLANGRFDLGMSSFTDTKDREKTVNFVTYFSAGTSFFTKASGGPAITGLSSLCGLKVAVESGTTQESDSKAQSKKCTQAGKAKVTVLSFNDQSQANLALNSGRAEVGMADSPVAAYQVKQSNGAFKLAGQEYGAAPYGIAVPKQDGTLDQAVLAAVKDLISNGTYGQIMSKWGLTSGAITDPVINGAIS